MSPCLVPLKTRCVEGSDARQISRGSNVLPVVRHHSQVMIWDGGSVREPYAQRDRQRQRSFSQRKLYSREL
ncbi:hypothetical protein TNCV_3533391 [Trichonephila clavipes]|nr:hypothetical protein TNCV_3533391 [Trichonephila clavipes]